MPDEPQPGGDDTHDEPSDPDETGSNPPGPQGFGDLSGLGGLPGMGAFPGMAGIPGLENIDLAQVMRMLQSTGPVNWEVAAQVAQVVALEGGEERPVDPAAADQLSELAHAAQALVVAETGLGETLGGPVRAVTRTEWATCTSRRSGRCSRPLPPRWATP